MHAIPENRLLNISILWCLIFVSFSCACIILYMCLCVCVSTYVYFRLFSPEPCLFFSVVLITTVIKVVKTYIINTVSFPFRAYNVVIRSRIRYCIVFVRPLLIPVRTRSIERARGDIFCDLLGILSPVPLGYTVRTHAIVNVDVCVFVYYATKKKNYGEVVKTKKLKPSR